MNLKELAKIFKSLSNENRLEIYLEILKSSEKSFEDNYPCECFITEIITKFNIGAPTISHHLNILKKAKIVDWRKKGQWIYYSLKNPGIINGLNIIFDKKTVYNFSSFKITKK